MNGFSRLRTLLALSVLLAVLMACETPVETAGLRALHPEPDEDYVKVDSVRPTLRWEAFSIDSMYEEDTAVLTEVTYEIRVWRVEDDYLDAMVYQRAGLIETQHRIEDALEPSRTYQWSVRARFELNGQKRVGPWGVIASSCSERSSQIPNRCHYPFSTPPPQ